MKKFIAVLLSVILTVSVVPMTVFAASDISSVAISGVTEPVIGQTASFDYTVPESADYAKFTLAADGMYNAAWIKTEAYPESRDALEEGTMWTNGYSTVPTFEAGYYYTFLVALEADGRFMDTLTGTVNGKACNEALTYILGNYAEVGYTFYADYTRISEINASGIASPIIGKSASYSLTLEDDGLFNDSTRLAWVELSAKPTSYSEIYDLLDEWHFEIKDPDLTFKAGKHYVAVITAYTDTLGPVVFDSALTATVNGEEATWVNALTYNSYIYYYFGTPKYEYISELTVSDVVPPVIGASAEYTFTLADSEKFDSSTHLFWAELDEAPSSYTDVDRAEHYLEGDSLTFKENKYYVAVVQANLASAMYAQTVDITFNGAEPTFNDLYDTMGFIYYSFGQLEYTRTDAVGVTDVTAPVIGASASHEFSLANPELFDVTASKLIWVEMDSVPTSYSDVDVADWYYSVDGLTFKADKYYVAVVYAELADGVVWETDSISATVNGDSATFVDLYSPRAVIYYSFGQLTAPKIPTVSFDANGGTGTMSDVQVSGEYTLPENGFTAPDGYKFVGWGTDIHADYFGVGETINVTSDMTLYALWKKCIGDINDDGFINSADYTLLKRAVLGTYALESIAIGDINSDGNINASDYTLLKRVVLGTYTIG